MKTKNKFDAPGDVVGQWSYKQLLSRAEKIEHARSLGGNDQQIQKCAGRTWVVATCLGCGTESIQRADLIRSGRSQRCARCGRERRRNPYADPNHPLHSVNTRVCNAHQRCTNPGNPSYPSYGALGRKLHDRYCPATQTALTGSRRAAIENLLMDIGMPPNGDFERYSIDRIDNDGNYEPGNVRWAPRHEQANNRSVTVMVSTPAGGEVPMSEFSAQLGIPTKRLSYRLRQGYDLEAMMLPLGGKALDAVLNAEHIVRQLIMAGRYWSSADGQVFSVKKNGVCTLAQFAREGYRYVHLCYTHDGRDGHLAYPVHRFMAIQYIRNPAPETYLHVAHVDADRAHNHVDNLRWCTPELNAQAIHKKVVYQPSIRHVISPFCEDQFLRRMEMEYIDNTDYIRESEQTLRWGRSRSEIQAVLEKHPKYNASLFHPSSPFARDAWRFLLAPSNGLVLAGDEPTIELRINGKWVRRSVFDIAPTRDWSAYFVWYADELSDMGLDWKALGWSKRPLEEPERANFRNLIGARRKPLSEQARTVNNSLFLTHRAKAMLLVPAPGESGILHPLYIRSGSNAKEFFFRCQGCRRRILCAFSPKDVTRKRGTGRRCPLCALCQQEKSARNFHA